MKIKRTFLLLFLLGLSHVQAQNPLTPLANLAHINQGLHSRRVSSFDRSGGNNDRFENILPGQSRTLFDVKGAGMINHIWITIAPGPEVLSRNDIILKIYWDGNPEPSVHTPLGPFFGQGWNENYDFISAPLCASPKEGRGLVCYFSMPFAKGAKIEIENQNEKPIDAFYYYVDYYETDVLPPYMGRFHAWYNHELTTPATENENEWTLFGEQGKNPDGAENYLFADIKGKGHFVGVNYYVQSPGPMWYGEGDDMIFIDGDKLPTLIGTGTEDYFNTSWSPKEHYMSPYFGYPRINTSDAGWETGWQGRTHLYRFHIQDPLYFDKSLKFTIEHGHNNCLVLDLASVAYWYQEQASGVPAIASKEERKPKHLINPVEVHKWRDAWLKANQERGAVWGNE